MIYGPGIAASEYCTERYYNYLLFGNTYATRSIYCPFGCCGNYNDEYCCINNAGYIIGIVFGGIVGLIFLITIICCCVKHSASSTRGRTIQPAPVANGHTTHTTTFITPTAPPNYSSVAYSTSYSQPLNGAAPLPQYSYPPAQFAPPYPGYNQNLGPPVYSKPGSNIDPPPSYSSPAPYD
ncbi:protein shisa-4-like [Physella acuta]|uniref:protein shisa-4-like n=1 Tax=Physella acuta TaxID=109671 RepID=UPI0027DDD6AE|nr:protein shisa-4-like [Physella acuta]